MMSIDFSTYHYPPELMNLLIETIPLLCRSKMDLIVFFRGAGVDEKYMIDIEQKIRKDRGSINKYEITRTILSRLNEEGDITLQPRREIIKRVVEFEDFSCCWPSEELKAKGAVSEVRRIVNVKDSFTRMNLEREKERQLRQLEQRRKIEEAQKRAKEISIIKSDLFELFSESNAQYRGKRLESVLNSLFEVYGILIKEAFTVTGDNKEGIVEQIDGVVELDGNVYLVEMKWLKSPVDIAEVSQHLVRIYHRGYARGIFISASNYTKPAINICREALQKATIILCGLDEIVRLLEEERDLKDLLKQKINAAIINKNPFYKV